MPAAIIPFPRRAPRRVSMISALALAASLALVAPAPVLAFGAPESFAELADKISPSVVNITTSSLVAAPAGGGPVAPVAPAPGTP